MNRTRAEKGLLLRTAVLFVGAHALSHQRMLQRTRDSVTALAKLLGARAADPAQLMWAVAAVNRRLPGRHSCLINALCCEAIARNSGIAAEFRIGAARRDDRMHFHAWVEHAGTALTDAHDGEFATLR